LLLSTCFQCNLIFFYSHRNVKNKNIFSIYQNQHRQWHAVFKNMMILVWTASKRKKKSIAHTTKSNLLLWSRKSNSSNSSTLLPNRSTDMMCCAQERERERDRKKDANANARSRVEDVLFLQTNVITRPPTEHWFT